MHNPIEMHHHQSRHAQSLQRLSHSSCSNLELQSPPILIWKHTCTYFSSLILERIVALLGINLRVLLVFYGIQLSDKEDILANTCKTSGGNDLTPGYIGRLCRYESHIYPKTSLNAGRL